MKQPPRGYIATLDGWRAIAILAVCVAHTTDPLFAPGAPYDHALWYQLTRYGAKGVDLFFGISGFLICSRLLEEFDARGRISLKGFYVRRFARILPPYYAFLAALAVLGLAGLIATTGGQLLASLFFVRNYYTPNVQLTWYTGHLWSLAVEEHFYLLWPGLLVLWGPARARWRVAAFALLIAAWRVVEFRLHLLDRLLPDVGFFTRTDLRLDALLWGCWLALLLQDEAWRERLTRWLRPAGWLVVVALWLATLLGPPLALMWQAILVPLILAGTVLHPGALAGRVLETRPLRWIGRISYSLYLWQQLFFPEFGLNRGLGMLQMLPISIAALFAVAAFSYYVIERPMIRLGHRLAPPTTEGRA